MPVIYCKHMLDGKEYLFLVSGQTIEYYKFLEAKHHGLFVESHKISIIYYNNNNSC